MGEDYVVYLNDSNVPRLRISAAYEKVINTARATTATRDYVLAKLNSARWLIQTIEQRRQTMVKVMQSIVEEQHDFFENGVLHLRPLTLQDVASKIGMHESTVSRVTTGKYVQTPRGVFELKFFFSSGLDTRDGEEISAKSAKAIIPELIEREDSQGPPVRPEARRDPEGPGAGHRPPHRGQVPRAAPHPERAFPQASLMAATVPADRRERTP